MSNREKKKLFNARGKISKTRDNKETLSLERFVKSKNSVYIPQKKIELQQKENAIKSKYNKYRENKVTSQPNDFYDKYMSADNDPMARFAIGDDSKYNKLDTRKKNNKKNDKKQETEAEQQEEQQEEKEETQENFVDKKDNNKNNEKEKKEKKEKETKQQSVEQQFKLAKQQYLQEKKEKQELFKQIAEKKEATKLKLQEKRADSMKYLKKTKRGQPIMLDKINRLLSKIEESK
ncbi:hypothetical protein CYY_002169 [Polysphondylium violaceum]|uniref:rRNA-processing protein FYV7 n=1 Tax=Polysphondylium violaceum TaxID=133409 RepID=A0A8J4PZN7_9MYCE|nr:hypothetical protein CYY_002169 [Polysphondylium violaceum]